MWMPSVHIQKTNQTNNINNLGSAACASNLSVEEAERKDPWSSLARQSDLIGELQANERPSQMR